MKSIQRIFWWEKKGHPKAVRTYQNNFFRVIQLLLKSIQPSKLESHNPGMRYGAGSPEHAGTEIQMNIIEINELKPKT